MTHFNVIGAVLMAAIFALALPALAIQLKHGTKALEWMRPQGGFLWDLVASELGATVTYLSKFGGVNATTAPTAVEANFLATQVAQVFMSDAETEAIMVHNWGGALGPSFTSFGFPLIVMNKILGQGTAAAGGSLGTNFTFGLANSNQVYIEKAAGAPGGTFLVYLMLPHSLIARSH